MRLDNMLKKLTLNSSSLFLLLSFLPVLFLGYLVIRFGVNVPYWDQWDTPGLMFEKIDQGQLSFSDFIAQHNESRKLFPRLFFLGLAYLTHWDTRYEYLVIFMMACLISFNIYRLIQRTVDSTAPKTLYLWGLANLLIFSPCQFENWTWGIQMVVFTPILCLTSGILTLYSKLNISRKVVVGILLSTISTFSYANGLLCWFLLPVSALFSGHWKVLRRKPWLILLWILTGLLNIFIYFRDYVKPPAHPSLLEGLKYPIKAVNYFCAFLGTPLSGGRLEIAVPVGAVILVVFLTTILLLGQRWRDRALRYRVGGWLTLSLYVLISAVVTTLGRVGFGVEQALSSRYTTFSLYLIVALIGLTAITADIMAQRSFCSAESKDQRLAPDAFYPTRRNVFIQNTTVALAAACIVLHLVGQVYDLKRMENQYRDRLYARACLSYAEFVQNDCITRSLYPVADKFRIHLKAAKAIGVLPNSLTGNGKIEPGVVLPVGNNQHGWFENLRQVDDKNFEAAGWATLSDPIQSADAVLLTYQNKQNQPRVFTVAPVKQMRTDVAESKQNDAYLNSGWSAVFIRKQLPRRELELRAWAYDTRTGQSFPLEGSYIIQKSLDKVRN
jgi:hypothetical protein